MFIRFLCAPDMVYSFEVEIDNTASILSLF